jgi:hypothetical protein
MFFCLQCQSSAMSPCHRSGPFGTGAIRLCLVIEMPFETQNRTRR